MSNRKSKNKTKKPTGTLATNKKAFHNYEILERFEGGICLYGWEVKSIKAGGASLLESFLTIDRSEMWLWNSHISSWQPSAEQAIDATRKRKVLMKRQEIDTIEGKIKQKGLTLIPLKLYLQRGFIKLEIGLCRGRKAHDKRLQDKERTLKKELHEQKRSFML